MKKSKLKILIITFLILFSVIIIFTIFNKTGIISNIITKNEKNSESEARAKLQSILETASNKKTNNSSYNSDDFLTNLLEQENIIVKDNIVSLNNYNFVIDRDNLSISENLGETSVNVSTSIVDYCLKTSSNNTAKTIKTRVTLDSNIPMDSILFENSDGTLTTETVNGTTFSKDLDFLVNKDYSLSIVTIDGKVSYKKVNAEKINSLIALSYYNIPETGYYQINCYDETYDIHAYVYNEDTTISTDTLLGDANDVGTATEYAKNMVALIVNGDLTIDSGVTLSTYSSIYGGPKGFLIFVSGTLTNNGTITMTAKGAKAVGQNVYLWKNDDDSSEYIPAVGANGGASFSHTISKESNTAYTQNGKPGSSGTNRKTGGGGSGGLYMILTKGKQSSVTINVGAGASGTSYSGGSGGGAGFFRLYANGTMSSAPRYSSLHATAYGGAGGGASANTTYVGTGAGNPSSNTSVASRGENGTGGLLIIYADSLLNNSTISSSGSKGGTGSTGGGGSGGGSINLFYSTSFTKGSIISRGGSAGYYSTSYYDYGGPGGSGGNGSISSGCIATGTYVAD